MTVDEIKATVLDVKEFAKTGSVVEVGVVFQMATVTLLADIAIKLDSIWSAIEKWTVSQDGG